MTGYSISLTVDLGGGPLAGNNVNTFVVSLDPQGTHRWSKRIVAGANTGYSVAMDGNGNAYVTGDYQSAADFGGGELPNAGVTDIFVASYDTNGKFRWSKRFGGTLAEVGYGVTVDGTGGVLLTGRFAGTVDFGTGALVAAGEDGFLLRLLP